MGPIFKKELLEYHNSNAGTGIIVFKTQKSSKSTGIPNATLVEQMKPVVKENSVFECRDLSQLKTFRHSWTIRILMQEKKS